MSSELTRTCAGSPSRIATRDGPWDSPAVNQRSVTREIVSAVERVHDGLSEEDAEERPEQHERAERERHPQQPAVPLREGDQDAGQAEGDEADPDAEDQLPPAEVAQHE